MKRSPRRRCSAPRTAPRINTRCWKFFVAPCGRQVGSDSVVFSVWLVSRWISTLLPSPPNHQRALVPPPPPPRRQLLDSGQRRFKYGQSGKVPVCEKGRHGRREGLHYALPHGGAKPNQSFFFVFHPSSLNWSTNFSHPQTKKKIHIYVWFYFFYLGVFILKQKVPQPPGYICRYYLFFP